MAGLARICKMFGGLVVHGKGGTIKYVWDYAADKAVPSDEMPIGSERWKASERVKYELIRKTREGETK